ncbi:MAG: enoyl-CoA hydratase [Amphiplicatus sp.]
MPSTDQRETFESILVERPAPAVYRITLNRPQTRNAQDVTMLYELNQAFDIAARDDDISVIILAANGPHFSSGHDLDIYGFADEMAQWDPVGVWCGFTCKGAEGRMGIEKELFTGLPERWRNIPKVTIAQVHGKVISGALALAWLCDLIVAADNTSFADLTVNLGVAGAEYFNHPWELGIRKAKEFAFTADFIDAKEAHRLGMVNHVAPLDDLGNFTLALARKIAEKPRFALRTLKEALNAAQDAQGRLSTQNHAFALHQLTHSHNEQVYGLPIDPSSLPPQIQEKLLAGRDKALAKAKEED